jgi:L-rhamnose mutarotase
MGAIQMQRVCFLLKVRQHMIEEYKRVHKQVWPEMLEALRQSGWHNYSLFLKPDGLLVGYLETDDFHKAIVAMKGHPVNERWQKQMTPYFEGLDGGPDDGMASLEEVFHLQ